LRAAASVPDLLFCQRHAARFEGDAERGAGCCSQWASQASAFGLMPWWMWKANKATPLACA
jgi:hypothetical protein